MKNIPSVYNLLTWICPEILQLQQNMLETSVSGCLPRQRVFHLRCLRNVSSCLIYWGTLFCLANTWWVTPLCPERCGVTGKEFFGQCDCSPQADSLSPKHSCTQPPPAIAGDEMSVQMKPQMLWICGFPSIHADLLQNVQVQCCQTLLTWFFDWFALGWVFSLLVKRMYFQLLG